MSTSLRSEQLQRLSVPQTSTLVESKKTASILYDGKKAAEMDRQTIFDLGKSGLEELILSNSVFRQFQNTLFDDSTINFERSVETGHVNETLDKNIRKFLFHLSPYFLIRAAHNCLEWLIRRHRIHEYNVDDMMALILPYHATMTFVKCLQTMSLGKRSRWHWMQKSGVQLSKQTIINRAATDPAFLQFISKTTLDAVNELNANARAHTLQAWFAFYLTVTGALNAANEVTDSHVSNISRTLLKGMSSDVVDFLAASMMITAFLMTKIKFVDIFLKKIIGKVTDNMYRQELRKESVALLIIICQTQDDINEAAVETFLSKMMDNPTPITAVIGGFYQDNFNVMPLCLPLITKCLGHVVDKKKAKGYRRLMESLFTELALNDVDANTIDSWIEDKNLKPYVEHRDSIVKTIKNNRLKEAVKRIDEYLSDREESKPKAKRACPSPKDESKIVSTSEFEPYVPIARRNPADILLNRPKNVMEEAPGASAHSVSISQTQTMQNIVASAKIFGFLGVGIMGSGIVKNLLNSGHKVIIWNRDPSKARKLEQMGAEVALTPCDVAEQGDIIFSCVSDPLVSKKLVFGIMSSNQRFDGKGYVEMTGSDVDTSQDIADAIVSKGGRYLEARMQGSLVQAEEGTLIILAAGDRSLFDECLPSFAAMGKHSFFLGEVGNASKMYLVLQLFAGVTLGALAESFTLADKAGIPSEDVLKILNLTTMSSAYINEKGEAMIHQAYHPPHHPLKHMQKDLRLALSLSEQNEHDMPIAAATNEVYKHAKLNGYSKHDVSAVYVKSRILHFENPN